MKAKSLFTVLNGIERKRISPCRLNALLYRLQIAQNVSKYESTPSMFFTIFARYIVHYARHENREQALDGLR